MRAATILVVDDDPDVADVVASALSMTGHSVQTVGGGDEALEQLASRPYDLIVCDLQMPGIDGRAFYDRVVWEYPALRRRFMFLSGSFSLPSIQAFLTMTGAPALAKPFDVLAAHRRSDARAGPSRAPRTRWLISQYHHASRSDHRCAYCGNALFTSGLARVPTSEPRPA